MKKAMIIAITVMFLSLSTLTINAEEQDPMDTTRPLGLFDRTLVMGMIVNSIEDGEIITGNAAYIFYYSPGILVSKVGIVSGLKEVSMMKSPFLFIYEPGPFGAVTYVLGFARDFTISD
jgi:hypothetical protein